MVVKLGVNLLGKRDCLGLIVWSTKVLSKFYGECQILMLNIIWINILEIGGIAILLYVGGMLERDQ